MSEEEVAKDCSDALKVFRNSKCSSKLVYMSEPSEVVNSPFKKLNGEVKELKDLVRRG